MKILVTGGAGYIGSIMTRRLLDEGHSVVVADSLERGHREAVDHRATFALGNLANVHFVGSLFADQPIDAVLHFAAYALVGESMEKPGKYFLNNVTVPVNLLEVMVKHNVLHFIFSSSAAVYGSPSTVPIPEDHPKKPTNPYGESKLMVEHILQWYHVVYKVQSVSLRYFNAAGAMLDGSLGENHTIETHIIPNIIKAALTETDFTLFGTDYSTNDGTCVRDYIHVLDLAEAHLLALKRLSGTDGAFCYNVGASKGYSNKEVIEEVKKVSGRDISVQAQERRPGDPPSLIADASKIATELGFSPKYSDLQTIVESAWKWHRNKLKVIHSTSSGLRL